MSNTKVHLDDGASTPQTPNVEERYARVEREARFCFASRQSGRLFRRVSVAEASAAGETSDASARKKKEKRKKERKGRKKDEMRIFRANAYSCRSEMRARGLQVARINMHKSCHYRQLRQARNDSSRDLSAGRPTCRKSLERAAPLPRCVYERWLTLREGDNA